MTRMPDASVLLLLRWKQLRRALPAYGIVVLALAVVAAVWLLRRAMVHDPALSPYMAGGAVLMVFSLHQRRPDHHFLRRHLPQSRLSMALEYGAFILPVILGLLLANAWIASTLVLVTCALPWLPVVRVSGVRAVWLRKSIPAHLFEWRSALQQTYPWSLLLWLGALAFCWLPLLPLVLLGAMALMASGAMEQCEPRGMLLVIATDARALLRIKMLGAVRLMLALELPVLTGATWFQPGWWWIHLLFGLGLLVLVAYAVVLKYANYRPNERLTANNANVGIAAVFVILPGLCVVPLIMLLSEVRKARENLNAYFHDHHR